MEVVEACSPLEPPSTEPRSKPSQDRDTWRSMEQHTGPDGEKWGLVDVVLTGGAPWGFTLRGGLEYQEPLIITKVEEESRAELAHLQVGDEIVGINAVRLSGYRQEAICLVKSSFKTLALGLKRKDRVKGKNAPLCRPHSWHSSKVSENSSEVHETEDTAVLEPVWQTKRDAGLSSNDSISCRGQTNLQHMSCQFSSVSNMGVLEHSFNTHQTGAENIATTRSGDKHISGYKAFSSCTPEQSLLESTTSSKCMFYQGSHSGRRRFLQVPVSNEGCISPKTEDQASSRFYSSGRMNINPVWHVPEKASEAYSPPPPASPLRNDSFTATKFYETGLGTPYSHGPTAHFYKKSLSRVTHDHHFMEQGLQLQRSYNPPTKKDFHQVHLSAEDYCPNELNSTKLYSLSSTDVRQSQNTIPCQPQHQRQCSDESPFYFYPRNTCAPAMQSAGIYSRSLQNLPTNVGFHKQTGNAAGSVSSTDLDNSSDGLDNYRYYCITSEDPTQCISSEEHEQRPESEPFCASSDSNPANFQTMKLKSPLTSLHPSENKSYKHTVIPPKLAALSPAMVKSNSGKKGKEYPWRKDGGIAENRHSKNILNQQAEERSILTRQHEDDLWSSKNGQKICPQKTPLLHYLAQENKILAESTSNTTKGCTLQEKPEPISSKQGRRSDRYATTLFNEIQEKRAQLQKSRSAATLNCHGESEEDLGVWKSTETSTSSSDGSFTSTYKDHLKEAQAKVLQATSFKRRDLELPGSETFRDQLGTKSDSTNGHVSRIGSRKRFPLDKRIHSFSEPDKINEVGVEEKVLQQATLSSFVDRFKFFEGASRPTFSKPIPKKSQLNPIESINGEKHRCTLLVGVNDTKPATKQQFSTHKCGTNVEEQQRLGTFAEYEATWNLQRQSVRRRTSGRCHSAENILDSGIEEGNSTVCIHERSRSSPSADFHGTKISVSTERSLAESHPEHTLDSEKIQSDRTYDRGQNQLNISEPPEFSIRSDLGRRDMAQPRHASHNTKASCPSSLQPPHFRFQDLLLEVSFSNKGNATQQPSDHIRKLSAQLETTSPSALNEFHQKDPSVATPRSDWTRHNSKLLSAVMPSAMAKFPFCSGEVTAPSKYGYLQGPLISNQKLSDELLGSTQYYSAHILSNQMENTTKPISNAKNYPIRIVHAEGSSDIESKHCFVPIEISRGTEKGFTHQLNPPCSPEQHPTLFHAMQLNSSEVQKTDSTGCTVRLSAASVRLSEDDEKRQELARDIMGMDKSLVNILDQSKMKTTMDLMEGIYPQGKQLLEGLQQRRKSASKQPPKSPQAKTDDKMAATNSLATSSSYYNTSAPKAELLIKMKDMQEQMKEQGSEDELEYDLSNKKMELIDSLSRKLQILREARESLLEDMQGNNTLGEEVEAMVQAICKTNELDKFRMFVGDLDKVVSLLLSLSGRLARVENALNNLEDGVSAEEKHTLTEKRKLLICQHEDAKELKENLDRRERLVFQILASYLSEDRLDDYQHFVKMKSALIIEQRKLEDRIKLGEEQLKCLKDSLPLDQRLGY